MHRPLNLAAVVVYSPSPACWSNCCPARFTRLPAGIQPGEAAQLAGQRGSGGLRRGVVHPRLGRASPSLRWGWKKKQKKHKLNHVPGLTHGLEQKSEPGHGSDRDSHR